MIFRSLLLNFFALLIFSNCQSDKQSTPEKGVKQQLLHKWELNKRETSGLMPIAEGALPDYKEFYEFYKDGTFKKYRSNGWQAKGTFRTKQIDDKNYIEATYQDESVEGSCTSGRTFLENSDSDKLIENSSPCDGDILYYKKVESGVSE